MEVLLQVYEYTLHADCSDNTVNLCVIAAQNDMIGGCIMLPDAAWQLDTSVGIDRPCVYSVVSCAKSWHRLERFSTHTQVVACFEVLITGDFDPANAVIVLGWCSLGNG